MEKLQRSIHARLNNATSFSRNQQKLTQFLELKDELTKFYGQKYVLFIRYKP